MVSASSLDIEKGVPLPRTRASYPFSEMAVGDSFLLPADESVRVRNAACAHTKVHGAKFTTLKVGDGVRCWRVA